MVKRNIYLLCAVGLLQGMVFYAPVATLYRQASGLTIFEITLIESISLYLTVALEIPWGWAADRIGYRKTMVLCCGVFFLSKVVFWRAAGLGGFLLERVLLAVVCAGISGVDVGMLYLSCRPEQAHRVFSRYECVQQAGMILAAGVYALWIGRNYRLAALLTVFSYGAAALLALGLLEVRSPDLQRRMSLSQMLMQLKNRRNLMLLAAVALYGQTHQTITVFLNQLQYTRAGMTQQTMALAYILVSLCGLTGDLSAGLCRRVGERRFGVWIFLSGAGSCLLLAVTQSPLWSILAILCLRIGFSLLQPFQLSLQNRLIHGPDRATALSVNGALLSSLAAVCNPCFGRAAQFCLPAAMLMGMGLCLLSLVLWHYFQNSKSVL